MDTKTAFELLGLEKTATPEEIEQRFRSLAHDSHPDRGGTAETMAALNEARAVALKSLAESTAMVLVEALQTAMEVVTTRLEEQRLTERRVAKAQEQLRFQSTNRLRRYRRMAGIFAALSAAALFLGKDLPKEIFVQDIPAFKLSAMSDVERQKYEDYISEQNRQFSRMWLIATFGIAIFAGGAAWFFTSRIERVEHELRDLEEQTGTKTLLYQFLRDILGGKIRHNWTLEEMASGISE